MAELHEPKQITLPSGGLMKIRLAPFAESKALLKAFMAEIKGIPFSTKHELSSIFKDLISYGLSSPGVDAALQKCMLRSTIDYGSGDEKITEEIFEAEERREDYIKVLVEVGKTNLFPFGKNLYAAYLEAMEMMEAQNPESKSKTIT